MHLRVYTQVLSAGDVMPLVHMAAYTLVERLQWEWGLAGGPLCATLALALYPVCGGGEARGQIGPNPLDLFSWYPRDERIYLTTI